MTTIESILAELAQRMVDHPADIIVSPLRGAGLVLELHCHPEDEAKLIGKAGLHFNCLSFLVQRMGEADGQGAELFLKTRGSMFPGRQEEARCATRYDPEPTRVLLERILGSVELGSFMVIVQETAGERDLPSLFQFTIRTETAADFDRLQCSHPFIVRKANPAKGRSQITIHMSILDALQTILRAIAKTDGVRFIVSAFPANK